MQELQEAVPDHAPVPTAALLQNFCQSRIINKLPPSLRTVRQGTVTGIEVLPKKPTEGGDAVTDVPACRVHLSDGTSISARAVIVTCPNLQPVFPKWATEPLHKAVDSLQLSGPSKVYEKTILSWKDLLSSGAFDPDHSAPFHGKRVVIVGGGMTAALLALRAAARGATSVTLLARRPLLCQPFDCHVGWWGNKHLNAFWQDTNPENRMKSCLQARMRASLSPEVWESLAEAAASRKVTVLEGFQVESASNCQEGWNLVLQPTREVALSTAAPPQGTAFEQATAECTAKLYQKTPPLEHHPELPSTLSTDFVWLACGGAFNVARHPILSTVQQSYPTRLVAGYPVIDPGSCVWPGAPIYLIGKAAMLAMGPCAGDLGGIRLAAERIVKSLKKLDYAGTTEWEAAAETLAPQLAAPPVAASQPYSGLCEAQPTIVLENYLALEEEGLMCYERRVKPNVARPVHLVDISDLPESLPRHEIQKFSFSEDDFEICVTLALPEGVPLSSVRSMIAERSLEVWAIGLEGAYRLHVPRLYGRILPARSKVKVNEKKKKVFVILHKEKDAEWRFLKGV